MVIDVGEILSITETFVITHGTSGRQVKTIADAVEAHITGLGGPKPLRVEGRDEYQWVLIDFGPFVVHVFDEDTRGYYDLERLWADCPTLEWESASPA